MTTVISPDMAHPTRIDPKFGPPFLALSSWHGWTWHREAPGEPVIPRGLHLKWLPGLKLTYQPKGIEPVSIPANELGNTLVAQAHHNHTILESTWGKPRVLAGFRAAVQAVMKIRL